MCICVSSKAWHTVFFATFTRACTQLWVRVRYSSPSLFCSLHREGNADQEVRSKPKDFFCICASIVVWWWIVSCLRAGLPRQGTTQGSGIDTSALWRRQVQLDGECKQIRGTNIFSGDTLQSVLCSVHVIVCVVTPHMQVHSISCPYTSQPCHYCRGLYPACWLGEHVNHCSYRRVTCEFCGYETAINLMDVSLLLCAWLKWSKVG